jgi:hypothetical protein
MGSRVRVPPRSPTKFNHHNGFSFSERARWRARLAIFTSELANSVRRLFARWRPEAKSCRQTPHLSESVGAQCHATPDRHEPGVMRCAPCGLFWETTEDPPPCPARTDGGVLARPHDNDKGVYPNPVKAKPPAANRGFVFDAGHHPGLTTAGVRSLHDDC